MSTAGVPPLSRAQAEASGPLEARLEALATAVLRLEARIATLEGAAPAHSRPPEALSQELSRSAAALSAVALPVEGLPGTVSLMGLIGRVCLILGGATLIRALVDAGSIHRGWGVALGLAYALIWSLLADRARSKLDAAFHALASILIAYPLLVESSARFGILTPGLAALLLLTVTCLHIAVAWRRDLHPIIWAATLASLGSGLALMAALRAIEPFLAVFLLLGVGSLWLTYGRKWHGLRWPVALAADLGVLILTSLAAWPGGTPEAYHGITPGRGMLLALALVLGYLGSFALRMLQRQRAVTAFEVTQTTLVLLLGFGGALRVGLAAGTGVGLLGAGAALAGVGCYATALPFAEDLEATRANFNFFTFLGLIFLLLGGPLLLPLPTFAVLVGFLGLGAMQAGLQVRRTVPMLQSGLYLGAAAAASGLAAWTFRAFLGPAGPVTPLASAGLLVLACLAGTLALFLLRRPAASTTAKVRPLLLLLGAATAAGFGALAIRAGSLALGAGSSAGPDAGPVDAGLLAVLRTAVLSSLAILLAWSGRRLSALNLRWLVYPLLVVTALKFLFEDLAVGRPLTLFLGFMCFGTTLILAPRLLKTPTPTEGGGAPNPSMPEVDP
jgi:hypothetical protein